jgi:WD40 repeat protein/serine/threonine protein kinase
VAADDSGQLVLLDRLADEFAERYRAGERPSLSEYIQRHPQLADEIREFFPAMVEMEQVKDDRQAITEPAATGPLPPLERLGDFRIIREIGHGGMGVVYEAEQVSLGRHVALKVLPKQLLADVRTKQRFEREARAAARLHHTNIVPVFGVGEHEGLPYYVMQFIPGLGLDEVLTELKKLQPVSPVSTVTLSARRGGSSPPRDVSAAGVARSLMTGQFKPAARPEENVPASRSDVTTDHVPSPHSTFREGDRAPDARPPCDGTLSSSSVVLPGQSRTGSHGRKPSYWRSVATMGVQVAEALEYAHHQAVVHRDIKPSNLLLDTTGTVWVTDFGLAKADDQQNLTHTGDVLGTYRYMPPEAFEGKTDARGDVYSLGLTLYELLAFRPGFGEPDRAKLIKLVTTTQPPRLGKVNPQVPRDLETIVHKAIERDPACRYQSARELAADLQHFVDDEPVRARPVGPAERCRRWCRRNPLVASLTAAVAFLLVAGSTMATYFAIDATLARDRADAEALKAEGKANEALAYAQREAGERAKATVEKERADREADAARANLYVVRLYTVKVALDNRNMPLVRDLLEQLRQPGFGSKGAPGWEWNYLWRFCHNEECTLRGHEDDASCVAFTSDGARLATSADDGAVRLWDVATGRQLKSLLLKQSALPCLAFSPDGTRLAVGAKDGSIRVLDAARWQELSIIKGHTKVVRGLAFSPNGNRLFTVSEDRTLKIWDMAGVSAGGGGKELHSFQEPAGYLRCVAVSPDGKWLALGGQGATLKMRDAASGKEVRTLPGHTGGIYGVAFSADGKRLASTGMDRTVKVWDVANGQELHTLTGHTSDLKTLAFSPDGKRLASGGVDQMLKVWDLDTDQEATTYLGHTRGIYGLAFSPDGRWLASASADRTIKLWDTTLRPGSRIYNGHDNQVRAVAFHPDPGAPGRLVSVGLDGRIKVWDVLTHRDLRLFSGPGPGLLCVALSPDGRLLATGGDPGVVTVWDVETGRNLWSMKGHASWLTNVAFSPDNRWLASGGHDRLIKLWDAATGGELRTLAGHKDDVKGLVFSPDGARIISGSNDETIKVWDAASGQELQTLKGHGKGVTDIALSGDGRWLASTSHDQTVRIWDLATGQVLRTLRGHNDTVWSVAFHPSGARLATAGWDQTVRVWDPATGLELTTLKGHTDRVLGVAFSPDGGFLASAGGKDLSVRVWDGRALTLADEPKK